VTGPAERAVAGLARLAPTAPAPGDDLARAVRYLGLDVEPATVTAAAVGGVVPVGLTVAALVALVAPPALAAPLGAAAGVAAYRAVERGPVALAAVRRTRAAGATAEVVGRVAVRLRVEPSPERAAAVVARTTTGPLAASLARHVRQTRGGPGAGLRLFGDEWRETDPALARATRLLAESAADPPDERERTLERALRATLDGARERVAAFAGDVRGPLSGLYAFGVLLPLALVGTVPAASVAGLRVGVPAVVLVYDLLLPALLVGASAALLGRRPVAFPPPSVGRDHPRTPNTPWRAVLVGLGAATGGAVVAAALVGRWAAPVAAVGLGVGAGLVTAFRPAKRVRDRTREAEADLPDALRLVGRRVAAGEAVEPALAAVASRLDGETGRLFREAVDRQRRLGVTVGASFLRSDGALAATPSRRFRGAAALCALAAREGQPAGEALTTLGDHLAALRRVEREGRRELSAVTGTLANTAALFGPLVGGATVALAAGLGGNAGPLGGRPLPVSALGPAVGAYVLLLAATLTALSTGLERGLDRSLAGYRVGLALASAPSGLLRAGVAAGALL
jgi:Flp pilus assembly protein TadB